MQLVFVVLCATFNQYDRDKLHKYREEVREMFSHSYESYLNNAYPYDELRPLSCDGLDTWGSYSLTLIDALDTLAVMGNYTEFQRVYSLVAERENFDSNINVSVFETNIRIVGGLISAHLMAKRAGVPLEEGWPCTGPLLRLAEDAAERLLPAFDTPTGMPYGTVNLRHGVPEGETPVTCTAGVGTFVVEFGALSRLTGNPVYESTAMRAMRALWSSRSGIGLVGNHIDVLKGRWTAVEAGIGAGVDSYFEYMLKGSALLGRPELRTMFNIARQSIDHFLRKDDWFFWANMKNGQITQPIFQSLEAFWPGMLSLIGDIEPALKSLHNYHQVWKQYGFTPEFYNVVQGSASVKREGYPLRPELIESIMYLYRATGDPWLVDAGVDILKSIQHSAYTPCGYATIKNSRTHSLDDRMESFFLAETVKYLYLLFDPDNFIHNTGTRATIHHTPHGRCVLDAGGYIFNTEAHPIDPAALACCSELSEEELKNEISDHLIDILNPTKVNAFRGDLVPERLRDIEAKKKADKEEKRERELEALRLKLAELKIELQEEEREEEARLDREKQAKENNDKHSGQLEEDNSSSSDSPALDNHEKLIQDYLELTEGRKQGTEHQQAQGDNSPEFSQEKQSEENTEPVQMGGSIEKLSTGEYISNTNTGIVQPATMPDVLEKPANKIVAAMNKLVESFLTPKNYAFDLEKFTENMKNDVSHPVNVSWYTNYEVMHCPAQKFTDRFLIHGEFFG